MTEHDVERMLEGTDLSNRSKIRTSLRRTLLDRDPKAAPRTAWAFNAMAFGVIAVGVFAILALVMGGGGGNGIPASQPTDAAEQWSYTVQDAEDVQCIVARVSNLSNDASAIEAMLALNGLQSVDQIQVGQTLLIPTPAPFGNASSALEASGQVGFQVLTPAYIPAGMALNSLVVNVEGTKNVTIGYIDWGSTPDDIRYLSIHQLTNQQLAESLVWTVDGQEPPPTTDVTVRGQAGKYYDTVFPPPPTDCEQQHITHDLAWNEGDVQFRMVSNTLTMDEMLKVAESLVYDPNAPTLAELPTVTPPPYMATPTIVPYHHTVQAGETLLDIVRQYGWTDTSIFPTIMAMNGLENGDVIEVGMVLLIPPRIETAPFEPCPAGYNPGVPPTMVPGQEVPSSETATPFPTIVPCMFPTSAPVTGGDFGPNSAMTATPIPFDPAAPTVPPSGFMLPTPTAAQPTIESIEELSRLVGFAVVDLVDVPAGYELLSRGAQMYTQEMKGVTTTYIRRASAVQTYIQLKQLVPSRSLTEMAEWHGVIDETVYQDAEVNDQDALWIEGYDMGVMYSSLSQVQNILIWNTGEFSFLLTSADLTLDEMIALAESVE